MEPGGNVVLESIEGLHKARTLLVLAKASYDAAFAEFINANLALVNQVKIAKNDVDVADGIVRAVALAQYKRTKEKKVAPGVEIKLATLYKYESAKALEWAKEKKLALVPESLDVKSFEKIIKATNLDFVLKEEEPAVSIATDLGKALAEAQKVIANITPELEQAIVAGEVQSLTEAPATIASDDDNLPF